MSEPDFSNFQILQMPDCELMFFPELFSASESQAYLTDLTQNIAWEQLNFKIFGKVRNAPRLTAWYADPAKNYSYSGITHTPQNWTDSLQEIKARVETASEATFNSVLLNLYRNGEDSMGWHSDDEPELGPNPLIASVSFGTTRSFQLRHKQLANCRLNLDLPNGSLLVMRGTTQHFWQHQLPKTKRVSTPRLNLTFRTIL